MKGKRLMSPTQEAWHRQVSQTTHTMRVMRGVRSMKASGASVD